MIPGYCVAEKTDRQFMQGHTRIHKGSKGTMRLSGKCAVCGKGMSRMISEDQGRGLLSMLGIHTPLANIPVLGQLFF